MEENLSGFFNDDGIEIDPKTVPTHGLCYVCKKHNDPAEEIDCILNRNDQKDESLFQCCAYEPIIDNKMN